MKDCIEWPGTNRKSDGRPVIGGAYVYRIVFEQRFGRLVHDQVLHHVCNNSWCINPEHLVPMTQRQHLQTHGVVGDWGQRFKTHCPAGHPYSGDNLYAYKNERHCKACKKEAKARYLKRWRKKQAQKKHPR